MDGSASFLNQELRDRESCSQRDPDGSAAQGRICVLSASTTSGIAALFVTDAAAYRGIYSLTALRQTIPLSLCHPDRRSVVEGPAVSFSASRRLIEAPAGISREPSISASRTGHPRWSTVRPCPS